MKCLKDSQRGSKFAPFVGFIIALVAGSGQATPFPNFPLQTGTGSVPPNVMFILDDSGSMGWPTMPENVYHINNRANDNPRRRSHVHNTIFYNPAIDYKPWLLADGERRMEGGDTYPFVYLDTTQAGPGTLMIDLSNPDSCGTARTNTDAEYCGGGLIDINKGRESGGNYTGNYHSQTFYVLKEGVAAPSSNCRGGNSCRSSNDYYKFTILSNGEIWRTESGGQDTHEWRHNPTRITPDIPDGNGGTTRRTEEEELNNYATWFSYHRTRMKAAKAAASEAFGELGPNFRVGYDSIWRRGNGKDRVQNNNTAETVLPAFPVPVSSTNDGKFEGDNRDVWFNLLFSAIASGNTPLRRALTRAGNYYETQTGPEGPWGPGSVGEQLSCRQSFAILTSDGHWNQGTPSIVSASRDDVDSQPGPEIESADGGTTWKYDPQEPESSPFPDAQKGTLADVAMHFWKRDLNPELPNNVPTSTRNPAFWQHMSTFAISIGIKGSVDQTSVSEVMERGGVTIQGVSQSGWPNPVVPDEESERRIDDMLHAAVNGRGEFVAASNPQEFADALRNSLAVIASRQAAGASVATNGPSLRNDSFLYQATYTSGDWTGDMVAVPVAGGPIGDATAWSMAEEANKDRAEFSRRNVWTMNSSGNGEAFPTAGQETLLARGNQGSPGYVSGPENARYIKGSGANEGMGPNQLRRRATPIGTIVNSSPFYLDENKTLFVGANDGMLHAVDSLTGVVRFSYVPAGLDFRELAKISSQDYQHSFFVDGGIDVTTRAQSGSMNRNILVASLGRGGKGVFGLDVTSPNGSASEIVSWDATFHGNGVGDDQRNTGFILGAPLVRRGNNGKLLAIYGNGFYSAEGSATLFIRDADTGDIVKRLTVDRGDGNGLAEVRAADLDGNGTADVLYAGDLKGNVWKFDISSTNSQNWRAAGGQGNSIQPLFTATDPDGNPQPITSAVALARDPSVTGGGRIFVVFGTGSYMIPGDLESTQIQTIYAVIDDSERGRTRNLDRNDLERRTIMASGVDELGRPARSWEVYSELEDDNGWYVDLDRPKAGERVVAAPVVRGRALWFATIIPTFGGGCEVGGTGYLNAVDVFTGTNPGRADGSTYSFIDVNEDGAGDDYLEGVSGGNEGLVTSVDVGIGMPSQPTFIDDDAYAAGSDAELGRLPGLPVGKQPARLRWHELVNEE